MRRMKVSNNAACRSWSTTDFAAVLARISEERPDALLVLQDAVTMQQRKEIIDFAIQERLPSIFQEKGWAVAGGLMSYGENLPSMYRRAAYFVDRIFKGVKPADLPVEQATKFDMVLNLKTAKAIGLAIPDSIFALVDEVVEEAGGISAIGTFLPWPSGRATSVHG
jgi:putative ABC transport system substrate-binding protein